VVVEAPERLGAENAHRFRAELKELVAQGKYCLVIDLGRTDSVDSAGLGALMSRIAATRSRKGDVRLAAPNHLVRKLLEITHLDQVLRAYEDVQKAIDSFAD